MHVCVTLFPAAAVVLVTLKQQSRFFHAYTISCPSLCEQSVAFEQKEQMLTFWTADPSTMTCLNLAACFEHDYIRP
jgi:predicted alpha/beta superfamily hydrolase